MKQMKGDLTIGGLARTSDVTADTLRFYERKKLLVPPRRTAGGYRLYSEGDAERVRFIRRAQAMGFTLEDIRELLRAQTLTTAEQCKRVADRLRGRVEAVDDKIRELRAFRRELVRSLARCEQAGAEPKCCPVVLDLAGNGRASTAKQ
jgi:DNA-binding transcriptional MerR regulator